MKEKSSDMARQPLVSIITIVLNGEEHIRRTLDSVLSQTYHSLEYIVIDGGSTDGTVEILREYDGRLASWESEPDEGISEAFNKGLERVSGEIIGLLNAGDWYEQETVQQVVDTFVADSEADVVCGGLQFWKDKEKAYFCHSVPSLLGREMSVAHPTCFIKSEMYRRAGLFSPDYKLAMDYELLLRFQKNGAKFVSLDRALTNMTHDGVSEKNWQQALLETHRARMKHCRGSIFSASWYYHFLLLKRYLRHLLERWGLDGLIRFYRQRLALVKKTKEKSV